MGSPVPKVFRGRGSKERQKYVITRTGLLIALSALSVLLYFRIPERNPLLWFVPSGMVFFYSAYFIVIREDMRYSLELMLFPPVFLSALSQYAGSIWIHFIVLPYLVVIARFARMRNIILLCALLPVINMYTITRDIGGLTVVLFYGVSSGTGLVIAYLFGRLIRAKRETEESLSSLRRGAREGTPDGPLQDEALVSHYLSVLLEVDDEISSLLHIAKNSSYADSASFFQRDASGQLELRVTTDGEGSIIMTAGGVLRSALNNAEGIIIDEIKARKIEPGYLRKDEFDSLIAAPVMEGKYALGVLAVDSDRHKAFKQADLETLRRFSDMLVNIVRRGRIIPQIKLEHEGLKILHEESSRLSSTINIQEMCRKVVYGVSKISGEPSVVFLKEGETFRLADAFTMTVPDRKEYALDDTLLDMSVKNSERFYLTDVTTMKRNPLPFKAGPVSSILCLPMIYESEMLGIIVTVSDKVDAFNHYQMELLDVLANQASMSLANARFHHEIEQLAITDGLTGLFNHRYFQERLNDEIKRVGRTETPLSLILADIDYFKKVNDTYGHPAGDAVLREMSRLISGRTRETDVAARYGGEEFAIILVDTDTTGAKKTAEDIRIAVKKTKFPHGGRITISLGISTLPENAMRKEEFVDKADQALYFAKESGRDRSVHWLEMVR